MTDGNIYDQSFVWQQMIADRWTYVFQTDLGINSQTTQVQGVNQTSGTVWSSTYFITSIAAGPRAYEPNGFRTLRSTGRSGQSQCHQFAGPNNPRTESGQLF